MEPRYGGNGKHLALAGIIISSIIVDYSHNSGVVRLGFLIGIQSATLLVSMPNPPG